MNGRKVDIRTAEPKLSEKIAIINKSIQDDGDPRRKNSFGQRGGGRNDRDNDRDQRKRDRKDYDKRNDKYDKYDRQGGRNAEEQGRG